MFMLYVASARAGPAPVADVLRAARAEFGSRELHEVVPGVAFLLEATAGGEAAEYDLLRTRLHAVAQRFPTQLSFALTLTAPEDVDWETAAAAGPVLADAGAGGGGGGGV